MGVYRSYHGPDLLLRLAHPMMPDSWWEWAVTAVLWVGAGGLAWYCRNLLRTLPDRLTAWLSDVAARMEPQPPECTCRAGGAPVAIRAWELGDSLETGATGPVIDERCPTCWLPRKAKPQPPRGPGAVVTGPQPPATGGVRYGGESGGLYWREEKCHPPYVARLLDGTTTYHQTQEEAKAWILRTAPRPPDPGKSQQH